MKKINYETSHLDSRGKISDLIENENINAVTLITITKDSVRGNHYHLKTWQWNYLIKGRLKLITKKPDDEPQELVLLPGDLVVTEPHEHHALVGLEDCEILVFTKGPRGGKEYESDTFRLEIPLA